MILSLQIIIVMPRYATILVELHTVLSDKEVTNVKVKNK